MLTDKEILLLIEEANNNLSKAYVPYSQFPVSSIIIDEEDNKYYGVNVENASYGLSICAERNAIFNAVYQGLKKIKYVIITGKTEEVISPCGACRQVIKEFSTKNTKIILSNIKNKEFKVYSIDEILPYGFGGDDLNIK